MKITIESTDELTTIGGVAVRHWRGTSEDGTPCHVFVHRIAVDQSAECAPFEQQLREMDPPSGPRFVDLRHIL